MPNDPNKNILTLLAPSFTGVASIYLLIGYLHSTSTMALSGTLLLNGFGWHSLYLIGLLLFLAHSMTFVAYRTYRSEDFNINKKELCIALVLFVSFIIQRFAIQDDYSMWLDEFVQAKPVMTDVIEKVAGDQHQPPFDYIFSYIGQTFFGMTEFGVRFHNTFFNSLIAPASFLLFHNITRSALVSIALSVLLMSHFLVIHFSIVARPISLGCLFLLFFLSCLQRVLNSKGSSKKDYLELFALALFLLLTLGLQPPFLLLSIFILFVGISILYHDEKRKKFLKLAAVILTSVLTYFPIQAYIFSVAMPRFNRTFEKSIRELVHYSNWRSIALPFEIVGALKWAILASLISFVIVHFVKNRRKNISSDMVKQTMSLYSSFFILMLYPLLLIPVFKSFIDWGLNDHYLTFFLFLAFYFFAIYFAWLKGLLGDRKKIQSYFLFFSLLLVAFSPGIWFTLERTYMSDISDWRGLYKFSSKNLKENDSLLLLTVSTNDWYLNRLIGFDYYYYPYCEPNCLNKRYFSDSSTSSWRKFFLKKSISSEGRVFVVIPEFWNSIRFSPESIKPHVDNIIRLNQFIVLEFNSSQPFQKRTQISKMIEELVRLKETEGALILNELHFLSSLSRGDFKVAREVLKKMKDSYRKGHIHHKMVPPFEEYQELIDRRPHLRP